MVIPAQIVHDLALLFDLVYSGCVICQPDKSYQLPVLML